MTHSHLGTTVFGGFGPQYRTRNRVASTLVVLIAAAGIPAHAAKEDGCAGGAFSIVMPTGILAGNQNFTIPKTSLGTTFSIQGKYVRFDVTSANFAVVNYTFNPCA